MASISYRPKNLAADSVEAVVCVHGVGSNFYGSTMMESVCDALLEHGIGALRVNTRGHDGVSTAATDSGGKLQGAAYEQVDECRLDVAAWVDYLVERGVSRIGLLGHSLGAIKILYAQAHQPQPQVTRLVTISPPRLAYSRFVRGEAAADFRASLETAEHWIAAGQPTMLFQSTFPFPLVLAAATFLDKYGPEERYNFLKLADRVTAPVSFIYGGDELLKGGSAFAGIVDEIASAAWPNHPPRVTVVPHANHFYAGCLPALRDAVLQAVL